ncbi:hypothetical protein AGMMS50256_17590 [Betaproteobacteria bacterium]|nr:hypothetical protein AGMMS50256_17590 [Betaproteobacteria bacterium]
MEAFEIIGEIQGAETFAEGHGIRALARLMDDYGGKNWRKRKGFVYVRVLATGEIRRAEVHWYEAHGIGKVEMKVKKCL